MSTEHVSLPPASPDEQLIGCGVWTWGMGDSLTLHVLYTDDDAAYFWRYDGRLIAESRPATA